MNGLVETLRLLAHLHRGGAYWYLWYGATRRSEWHAVGEASVLPLGGADVYFGVHPTCAIPATNAAGQPAQAAQVRAQGRYVTVVNGLFAEFDAKDFGGSKDLTRKHIETRLFTEPSVMVDSGGGFHCYFLFDQPFAAHEDTEHTFIDTLQKRFVAATGGDKGAKDLCRVLRLPGTVNSKYSPAREVELVEATGQLYTVAQLAEWVEAFTPPTEPPNPIPLSASAPRGVNALARFVERQPKGNRNNALNWASFKAKQQGVAPDEIMRELLPAALRAGLDERESVRTIQSGAGVYSRVGAA